MDGVPALYGGGGVSYNFLHLTFQEFLAAYHITQLTNGIDVFKQHSEDSRWEVVWRFLSGLTGFKYFKNSVLNPVFSCLVEESLKVEDLFLHCLFEGQVQAMDCLKATGMNFKTVHSSPDYTSPLDRYALGYCIAKCSSTTSWKVEIWNCPDESFMWGLNSNHRCNGIISHLTLFIDYSPCLGSYPENILHGIEHLELGFHYCGDKAIPLMNNLTNLCLPVYLPFDDDTTLTSFSNLIRSPKLQSVTIGNEDDIGSIPKPFSDILFGPSSFNELTLLSCKFEESCLGSLETNTNLTKLSLSHCSISTPPFQTLSKILLNKTIQKLQIDVKSTRDLEQVDTFKAALSSNTSLKQLKIVIHHEYCSTVNCTHDWLFITDPRVTIECDQVMRKEVMRK